MTPKPKKKPIKKAPVKKTTSKVKKPEIGSSLHFKDGYELRQFLDKPQSGYKLLGSGCTRQTFLCPDKKTVVKVCCYSNQANETEYANYLHQNNKKKNPTGVRIAKCWPGKIGGVPVLFMERIKTLCTPEEYWRTSGDIQTFQKDTGNKIPEWVLKVDCFQVGLDSKNNLVAFDVGNAIFGIKKPNRFWTMTR